MRNVELVAGDVLEKRETEEKHLSNTTTTTFTGNIGSINKPRLHIASQVVIHDSAGPRTSCRSTLLCGGVLASEG